MATKREDDQDFPAAAFAYVPDLEKPSTWKLRLWDSLDEKETARQIGGRIVLIDGQQLGRLMVRYNVGCRDQEVLSIKRIDEDFFD